MKEQLESDWLFMGLTPWGERTYGKRGIAKLLREHGFDLSRGYERVHAPDGNWVYRQRKVVVAVKVRVAHASA